MPANLPPELRSFVISNVHHKKDLVSLALTCHALREEAQRALFSSPVIHIYPKPHRSQISFLESTSSSPDRLALVVRRLTITVHVYEEFWRLRAQEERHAQNVDHARKSLIAWIEEVGEKLRKALQRMCGTTHLRFCYNADDSQFHPTWLMSLLNTCTFRLKTLVWEVEATDVELLIAKNLLQQDDLRTLKLKNVLQFDDDSQTNDLLRRFCPRLRTVSAPWPFVRAMLQHNRRILYVECSENFFGSWAFPTVVEQKHQHVKYLCWPSSFKNRSVSLPSFINLILLEISFLNPEDYKPITLLPRLEILILTSCPEHEVITTSRRLLVQSTSLAKVYCMVDKSGRREFTCQTYEPASGEIQSNTVDVEEMRTWRAAAGLNFEDIMSTLLDVGHGRTSLDSWTL